MGSTKYDYKILYHHQSIRNRKEKMKKTLLITALFLTSLVFSQDDYVHGADSESKEGVPKGTVDTYSWKCTVYKNTIRDYYVYVPAQYDASKPAALMIFQDGHAYVK